MPSIRTPDPVLPPEFAVRVQRLEALETGVLAARCLAGLGELSEVILGPRARHAELLLEMLLARARPELVEGLRAELLDARREIAEQGAALAARERAQLAAAERELLLQREIEELRRAQEGAAERAAALPEEHAALELGRAALEQIERELATLRSERDWRATEMRAAASALEGLRFRLLAPELQQRAQRWKAGVP